MKIASRLVTLLLLTLLLGSFLYTNDLQQVNSEEVFLTVQGKKQYRQYRADHQNNSVVIAKFNHPNFSSKAQIIEAFENLIQFCEDDDCQAIAPQALPPASNQLIPLSNEKSFAAILIDQAHGKHIKQMIAKVQTEPFWQNQKNRVQFGGIPYTNLKLDEYSRSIKKKLFPFFFVMSFILIFFLFKNLKLSLALFLPCVASALMTLTAIKYFFLHSNLVLAIIPLMMFILNMSLLFHVFYTAFEEKSFQEAIKEKKQPIFLMLISTFIGLISLLSSEIEVIRHFGLLSACLLVLSSGTSLIWTYFLDELIALKTLNFTPRSLPVFKLTHPYSRKTIAIFSLIAFGLGLSLFPKIHILTDANEYFPEDEFVKSDMLAISNSFVGTPLLDITFQTKDYNDIKEIEFIEEQLKGDVSKEIRSLSANKIVRFANNIYAKSDNLPGNKFAYQTLLARAPGGLGQAYSNLQQYRLTLFGNPMNVDLYENFLQKIKSSLQKSSSLKFKFNGLYYHLMTAQKEMIYTLFKSFLGTLMVISLITLVLFRNLKLFGIIFLVNIIPVFCTFCFFYITGMSFNIATVMTFSISLGIIVDSTFHQLHALTQPKIQPSEYKMKVVQPIILSALTLSSCFFMFLFNPFLPIRHFGISLSFVILVGALFDLKVLPPLIRKNFANEL